MAAYNDLHPRGNKLTGDEIKARRDQIMKGTRGDMLRRLTTALIKPLIRGTLGCRTGGTFPMSASVSSICRIPYRQYSRLPF
jgi:hypothetical protein